MLCCAVKRLCAVAAMKGGREEASEHYAYSATGGGQCPNTSVARVVDIDQLLFCF